MTDQAPLEHEPLRAADPVNQRRRDVAPAGRVLAVMVATLILAAGLNSSSMLERAESGPLGPARDLAIGFWRPVDGFSRRIGLSGPRSGLDALRDMGTGDEGGELILAGPDPDAPEGPTEPAGPALDRAATDSTAPTIPPPGSVPGPGSTDQPAAPSGAPGPDDGTRPGEPGGGLGPSGLDPAGPGAVGTPISPGPTAPADGATTGSTPSSPTVSPTVRSTGPASRADLIRRPTVDQPLDVLLVGDSTMDATGASLLRVLGETGLARATLDFRVSSGLARPDFFDWPAHLQAIRAQDHVDLVVIMVGANDAQPFLIDGEPESFGTERWFGTYRARVAALLQDLTATGGGVVWIGQPVMRKDRFDTDLRQLNQIYAEEVAKVPRAVYVDTRAALSDESGAYAGYLLDGAGDRQRVRQDDGVHLTGAGGDRVAPLVVDAINTLAPLY